MIQVHNVRPKGFTLVELTLSMTFVATLLLAIALLTVQITGIYNKGLTLRAVNQAGQLVSTDMERTLNTSSPQLVRAVGDARGGRLCAGTTIYAWNYGKQIVAGNTDIFNQFGSSFGPGPANPQKPMRLVKFQSSGTNYCQKNIVTGKYPYVPSNADEMLTSGDIDLAVHSFTINSDAGGAAGQDVAGDTSGQQRLYQISISLGSSSQSILNGNINGCDQSGTSVDNQYCAINKFTFTARAGNKSE